MCLQITEAVPDGGRWPGPLFQMEEGAAPVSRGPSGRRAPPAPEAVEQTLRELRVETWLDALRREAEEGTGGA
jgi:hypothetical protein